MTLVCSGWLHEVQWVLCTAFWSMDMTGVYACLFEALCDVTTVPSHFGLFASRYRKGKMHLLWKFDKKNSKEMLVKCATEVAHLHRVSIQSCTQKRPSPKVKWRSGDIIWLFLLLGLSLWNLAHLFIMFMATKRCLTFFHFYLGT